MPESGGNDIVTLLVATTFAAFLLNVVVTPIIISLAHRNEWYDERNHRKIHTTNTPRLGGVGMFLSFSIAAITAIVLFYRWGTPIPWIPRQVLFSFLGLGLIHGMGLFDDFVNLKAATKFFVQIAAASLVVVGGVYIRVLDFPGIVSFSIHPVIGIPITILWIVSIANAVNLTDGADGLAGLLAGMAALFMGLIALSRGNGASALIAFVLVGSIAGFMVYNFPPAKIFMGDSGSLFLGFILAVIPVFGFEGAIGVFAPAPVLTLLFIPVLDTILAMYRRIGRGLPIHSADKEHLHHRLIDRRIFGPKLLLVIFLAMAVFGAMAMAWYSLPGRIVGSLTVLLWSGAVIVATLLGKRHR